MYIMGKLDGIIYKIASIRNVMVVEEVTINVPPRFLNIFTNIIHMLHKEIKVEQLRYLTLNKHLNSNCCRRTFGNNKCVGQLICFSC